MGTMRWQPAWWNDNHASTWDRVKEAMQRDWEQTKHNLKLSGGHELNQKASDTVKQAMGTEAMPPIDRANPPKIIGEWNDVESLMEYGYGAREHYKTHSWSDELDDMLEKEWSSGRADTGHPWEDVRDHVRRGFEGRR